MFQKYVEGYFDSITYIEELTDKKGEPILNQRGKPIKIMRFAVPPSIPALCLQIGITHPTWQNYSKKEGFKEVCGVARQIIEAYLMQELNTRDNPRGVIFNLQNNYSMAEKHEVDAGQKTMSLLERRDIILKAAKEL